MTDEHGSFADAVAARRARLHPSPEAAAVTDTTTQHRPGCTRSGWALEHYAHVTVARCRDCGAVELREPGKEDKKGASQ